jgi:hypothetical protein
MMDKHQFQLWAMGDAHVGRDLEHGRKSLAEALHQSEFGGAEGGPAFDWDIAVNVGDYSGEHGSPKDWEGEEIVQQFSVLRQHRREQIYSVCGNHDRNALDEPQGQWFRKWIDPLGENTEYSKVNRHCRPFQINGTWERYSFMVGNILFLMMSDINEKTQKIGRGQLGGNPGGVVSIDTFKWWRSQISENNDKIIVSVHHYPLKDTTVASGDWEGMRKQEDGKWTGNYHKYYESGTPIGASYLYYVGGKKDSGVFEKFLEDNPGIIDLWLSGHTHAMPDDTTGNKSKITERWGTTFINVCPLTRYVVPHHARPQSRLLTFTEGSDEVRVQCYLHTDEYASQGWYDQLERHIKLKTSFTRR